MALATFNSLVRKGYTVFSNTGSGTGHGPLGLCRIPSTFQSRAGVKSSIFMKIGRWRQALARVSLIICLVILCGATADPVLSARKAYGQAKTDYAAHRGDAQVAWKFARATFDLADIVSENSERAHIAEEGIAACKQALEQAPDSAPLHYYLGLNQGELARTKTLGALRLVDQMEREFTRSIALDSSFDYGGAERSLGLLYRDAPALASIGSKTKARAHLQRALELAPVYPENRLNLIESELKWGDRNGARRDLKLLEEGWAAAQKQFSGPDWASSWSDWEARSEKVKKILEEPARLESPRH
jgi:tetratricopeptide (TPR) repeat protein